MRLIGAYFDLTDRVAPQASAAGRLNRSSSAPAKALVKVSAEVPDAVAPISGHPAAAPSGKVPASDAHEVLISVAKRLVPSAVRRNTVKRIVRESWRAALQEGKSANRSVAENMQGACLMRLKRYPGGREAAQEAAPGLTMIKQSLRTDADQLFATYLSRKLQSPRQRPLPRPHPGASAAATDSRPGTR